MQRRVDGPGRQVQPPAGVPPQRLDHRGAVSAAGLTGRGQARRETPDPAAEVGYRRVEAGRIPGRDRVRDGPVHRGLAAEFLAGQVAHRDYEVAFVLDLADVPGPQPRQRQPVTPGCRDRAGVDRRPG